MFAIIGAFSLVWAMVKAVLVVGSVGALAGAVAWGVGRMLPSLSGLAVAVALGALVMVGANASGYLNAELRAKHAQEVAQLEAQKAALARDLKLAQDLQEQEEANAKQREETLAKQGEVLERLKAAIEKHKDNQCDVGAYKDELDIIREL